MTNLTAITDAINDIGSAFDAFKSTNDQRVADLMDRLETLEAGKSVPGRTGPADDAKSREHMTRFTNWLRKPNDPEALNQLSEFQNREFKDVSIGVPAGGGFAVPTVIAREIERLELLFSPVRNLVKVVQVGTSDYKELVNIRGANSGWVGETDQRTKTDTPQLRERAPTHGELYAYPQASNWALDDIFFNVGAWLAEEIAQSFAIQEGDAVIRGDGQSKPTGLLATATSTVEDFASPPRAAGAFRHIESSVGSPAVAGITPDSLIDLVYSLNSAYRARASWVMNSDTASIVMKMLDGNGRFLWTESLASGQPAMLLGFPVRIWEQMDPIEHNGLPIGFGDWRRAYTLVDRHDLRVTRDEITSPGFTKFYVRKRVGGISTNNHAVRWIKTVNA